MKHNDNQYVQFSCLGLQKNKKKSRPTDPLFPDMLQYTHLFFYLALTVIFHRFTCLNLLLFCSFMNWLRFFRREFLRKVHLKAEVKHGAVYLRRSTRTVLVSFSNLKRVITRKWMPLTASGVDFTKGFKTWHKFSTEISFMLIPIIVLFIAHEFITKNFWHNR